MNSSPIPLKDGPDKLTDEELDALRQEGDPYADELAAKIFCDSSLQSEPGSRFGYNKLVDIADLLDTDAELLLLEHSTFRKTLDKFPEDFQKYYYPIESPEWVNGGKLELASKLWKDNSLAMLGILYAASLPACYLMKNGISALYRTSKLKDSKYLFQRIYETGLMLDSVMSPGGLKLTHDMMPESDHLFIKSLEESAGGKWKRDGDKFCRVDHSDSSSTEISDEDREKTVSHFCQAASAKSFLWGKGYIAAKKVRMLHASMRFMLLNPGKIPGAAEAHGSSAWPSEECGVPVNQEDLAFTLLTFSYLIPRGMEDFGIKLTLEEKEAFLHLWRVVGHIMGLRDDLMTDNWNEAKKLYERIHRLQAGTSPDGIALTEAVMGFLKAYLPDAFGISKRVPVALIGAQMGPDAKMLFSKENNAVLNSIPTKCSMFCTRLALRFFNRRYERLLRFIPIANRIFGDLLFESSEMLVKSWRDEYVRKPFYVPQTVDTWVEKKGVDDAFRKRLQQWRQHLFISLGGCMLAMGIMFAGSALGLVFWALEKPDPMKWSFIASLIGLISSVFIINVRFPSIFKRRPVPEGVSTRGRCVRS
jgi:hypothetical protein